MLKYNKIATIFILLMLCGCSTIPKKTYIPVRAVGKHEILPKPNYPILLKTATPPQFVKWCIATVTLCKADNESMRIKYEK